MEILTTLVQSLGLAYAAGVNLYATVALTGLAARLGWIGALPEALAPISEPWVIALAGSLAVIEFLATLIPGIASLWDTIHSAIRPPAAAMLAVLVAWHGDASLIIAAGLLGGGLGLATHTTKLGLRYAVDVSPEPVTNAAFNLAELSLVATLSYFIWQHPYLTLGAALVLLICLIVMLRLAWRAMRRGLRALLNPYRQRVSARPVK
ncbi:MAG: DUF4126 domain-containing protein [Gemmatimonadaceae bacterium]